MNYKIMNGKTIVDGEFSTKEILDMVKAKDERASKKTQLQESGENKWHTIAELEDLEDARELLFKNSDDLIFPLSTKKKKSGVLISFFLPGIGELYLGQTIKGVVLFVSFIFLSTISFGLLGLIVWVLSMIDTYKLQSKLLNGMPIQQWEFF